jgi:hypothetical protein
VFHQSRRTEHHEKKGLSGEGWNCWDVSFWLGNFNKVDKLWLFWWVVCLTICSFVCLVCPMSLFYTSIFSNDIFGPSSLMTFSIRGSLALVHVPLISLPLTHSLTLHFASPFCIFILHLHFASPFCIFILHLHFASSCRCSHRSWRQQAKWRGKGDMLGIFSRHSIVLHFWVCSMVEVKRMQSS